MRYVVVPRDDSSLAGGTIVEKQERVLLPLSTESYTVLCSPFRYSILAMTGVLALMSCAVMGTRSIAEGFTSVWSAFMLLALSIGGTMIMRKFHNSMAVGFFMGGVVAMAQMFFFLSLV